MLRDYILGGKGCSDLGSTIYCQPGLPIPSNEIPTGIRLPLYAPNPSRRPISDNWREYQEDKSPQEERGHTTIEDTIDQPMITEVDITYIPRL